MQSKAAKIGFIVLILLAGLGVLYFKMYGPGAATDKQLKGIYKDYVKTEATIVSQESNGRIGKAEGTIWTVQFKDAGEKLQAIKLTRNTTMAKETGEKIIVYYNPANPNEIMDEKSYDEVMN